ncbi:MAG: hypothetical protein Q8K61_10280 [Gallionella sp.]|nr:hypothetical protein [Gallionella sp.]
MLKIRWSIMTASLKNYPVYCGILMISLMALSACDDRQHAPVAAPVKIESFEELIIKHNCLACHLEGNSMGLPAWPDVAEKYTDDKTAAVHLINKIRHGGAGEWGKMDMPPYPEIDEAELNIIVDGILSVDYPKKLDKAALHKD